VEIISTPVVVVVVGVLEVEIISTPVVVVVVVVLEVEIISTPVVEVVVSRELSCSESVLWTTNYPLVLACCGLEAVVTFSGHFHTVVTLHFRIQSVFLFFNKIHA
jgi:hypothetical protein